MPATTLDVIVQMNIQAAKSELMKLSKIVNRMNQNVLDQNTDVGKYKKLQKAASNYNSVVTDLGKNHPISQQARAEMDGFIKQLKITKGETTKLLHNNKKFKFDFLTLLFVGMMLTKTFGGMFRNIIDSYKKITGLHSVFNKSLLKLQAGFGYLKFAIANALNSPGIIKAIEWFTNAIVWLGDYLSEHPTLSEVILAVIAALVTIGTVASISSGLIQMKMLLNIFSAGGAAVAIKNLGKLAALGAIAFSFKFISDAVNDDEFDVMTALKTAVGVALGVFGIAYVAGATFGAAALGGILIGSLALTLGVGIALMLNADKSFDKAENIDPGWAKVGTLIWAALKTMIGAGLIGAAIGGGIGAAFGGIGFIPGAAAGFIIGTIIGGISSIIKMTKPEIEYGSNRDIIREGLAKMYEDIPKKEIIVGEFGVWSDSLNDINPNLTNTKNNIDLLSNSLILSKDQINPFSNSLFQANENQLNLNNAMSIANDVNLPTNQTLLANQTDKMDRVAYSTNKAAAAQERYNKALANKKSSSSSASSSSSNSSSYSSTTRTSSFYDSIFT